MNFDPFIDVQLNLFASKLKTLTFSERGKVKTCMWKKFEILNFSASKLKTMSLCVRWKS